jgi:hypothetical protein
MNVESVSVNDLSLDPANARAHPERNMEAVRASLRRFGQQKPIVARKDGVVIAGNGTLQAARELGWDTIAVVWTDLESTEAVAYSIADNRSAELAQWDERVLVELLESLQDDDGIDIECTGCTDMELALLAGRQSGEAPDDPNDHWDGMPEFENEPKAVRSIQVHFSSHDDVADFARIIGQKITDATKYVWHPERKPRDLSGVVYESEAE